MVYEELHQEFGYAPPSRRRSKFSTRHKANRAIRGSARMVGLPYLGTVAASTGRIVALVSPGEIEIHGGYAWARALKHEMTHVFNLQQTGYNNPHWLTKGLAVYNEKVAAAVSLGAAPPPSRRPAGTLMNLDNVNAGFSRAMEGDDCNLAYCQGELYVEYMVSLGGADVLKRTVAAYAETPATADVMQKVFGRTKADFERGYSAFLRKQIDTVPVLADVDTRKLRRKANEKLQAKEYDAAAELYAQGERLDPANPQWAAGRAKVFLVADRQNKTGTILSRHFAELEPNDLASREKLAALSLELGDAAAARRWATAAIEINVERTTAHHLLAESLVKLNELNRAVDELSVAVDIDPANLSQRFDLADALLQAHQSAKAKAALQELFARSKISQCRRPAGKPGKREVE